MIINENPLLEDLTKIDALKIEENIYKPETDIENL